MKDRRNGKSSSPTSPKIEQTNGNGSLKTAVGSTLFGNFHSSQEQLTLILDSVPSPISYLDTDLSFQYVNAAYEKWLNIPAADVIGKSISEVLGKRSVKKLQSSIDAVLSGEPVQFETEIDYPTGQKIIQGNYTPDLDEHGHVRGYIELINDITSTKKVELEQEEGALKKADAYLRSVIDNNYFGFSIIDTDGKILLFNKPTAQRIHAINKEFGIGDSIYDIVREEFRGQTISSINKALQGTAVEIELPFTEHGRSYWLKVSYTPIYGSTDKVEAVCISTIDITDQKAVEQKLIRNEKLFRSIVLNIPGSVVMVVDKSHRFLLVEGEIMDKLGYDRKDYEGKHPTEVSPAERYEASKDLYDRMLSGEKFSVERKSETGEDYIVHCVPLKDETGEVYAGMFVALDVTTVKETEEKIKQSEKRFRSLIEKSSDGIALCDAQGNMTYLSPSTEKMLGYSVEEMLNHSPWEYMHPNDVPMMQRVFMELVSTPGNVMQAQWRKRHKNGSYRWLEGIGTNLLDDPALKAVVVNFRDITERKVAEDYTGKLAAIVESSDDAIVSKTLDGTITSWNFAAERIFGYTAAEMIGQSITRLIPPDRILEETMIIQRLRKGESVDHFQTKRMTKDGRLLDVSLTISPIRDGNGNIIGASKIARDITDQKLMEEAVRESEKKYRQLIEGLPVAIYTTDAEGHIMLYNDAAVMLWGREPEVGKDMWCGSWKIYDLDGNPVELDSCPMAQTLHEGRAISGTEIIVEKPDGTRRNVLPHPKPIFDANGRLVGAVNTLVDITEQKLAYQRLRESEKRFKAIADHAPVMIWMSQPDRGRTFFNKQWLEFTGRTIEEETGLGWVNNVNPVDRERVLQEFNKALETQTECRVEYRLRRHDGEYRWVTSYATPRYSPNKTFLGFVGAVTDITDNKKAELAVRESEKRFRTVANTAPVMIWMSGVDKQCDFFNMGWLKFRGRALEEELGSGWIEGIHPEDVGRSIEVYRSSFDERKPFELESRFKRYDGTYRWIATSGVPRFDPDGSFLGYIGSCVDVTDRKTAAEELERQVQERTSELRAKHEQLQQQKEFVDTILDTSVDAITVIGKQLEYLAINKKAYEEWDLPKEVVLGKKITDVFPNMTNSPTLDLMRKALAGEQQHQTIYRSTENDRYFETYFVPLLDNKGEVYACLNIAHDTTSIVQMTEQLRSTNQRLEERNKELARSNNDLEQFAYIASHDLQEPLRKIRMFSARLQETNEGGAGDPTLYIEKIMSASERMSDLINALLNYSRLSHPEENFVKTDLNDIAKKVISDFDIVIHEKNALITLEKLPKVEAIPLQMNQLFHNLISNSLKFTRTDVRPDVRITSRLLSREESEAMNLNEDTEYCQIMVSDNGIGFEQEYAEKIFVIFQRLNGKQEYKGTGIGLAICKKIVDTHRGRIFAEGKEGVGATFNLVLPIKQMPRTV